MRMRGLGLTIAAAGLLLAATAGRSEAGYYYHSSSPAGYAALKQAYAYCNAKLWHLSRYRGGPQRFNAIEGCVQDVLGRRW